MLCALRLMVMLGAGVRAVDISEVQDAISRYVPRFAAFYSFLSEFFGWLDFIAAIGPTWNCGATLMMMMMLLAPHTTTATTTTPTPLPCRPVSLAPAFCQPPLGVSRSHSLTVVACDACCPVACCVLRAAAGGALSIIAPVVLLIGAVVFTMLLQKDYILRFAISVQGASKGVPVLKRQLRVAYSTILTTLSIYMLQVRGAPLLSLNGSIPTRPSPTARTTPALPRMSHV